MGSREAVESGASNEPESIGMSTDDTLSGGALSAVNGWNGVQLSSLASK
jgi:hypothetical protein